MNVSERAEERRSVVAMLRRHAEVAPEKVAVVEGKTGRTVSYAALLADVERCVAAVRAAGGIDGSVVSVQLPNWYETVVIDCAVLECGAVLNPLLPGYRHNELEAVRERAKPALMVSPRHYRNFDFVFMYEALDRNGNPIAHVTVEQGQDDLAEVLAGALVAGRRGLPLNQRLGVDASELIFTSGTQAAPKGVLHSEQTVGSNIAGMTEALSLTRDDIVWVPSPVGHSTGLNFGVRLGLTLGCTVALQDVWDPGDGLELIEAERCTYTLAAPTFLRGVVDLLRASGAGHEYLRAFACGGAPVPPALVDEAEDMGMKVLRLYGSTEALVMTVHRPEAPLADRRASDGPPLPGIDVRVVTENGEEGWGVVGEIEVRGTSLCVGLLTDDGLRSLADADGWARTEDIGVLGGGGYLRIVDRKKEIIIRGGMNISASEVEHALLGVEGVTDAAVIGVADERLGEQCCACVVVDDCVSEQRLADIVRQAAASGLATYKLPEQVYAVAQLPRTPTGKIQKHVLRSAVEDGEFQASWRRG
ncbi:MAG: AMP-binding protein [Acidimicrobiales bacterium]